MQRTARLLGTLGPQSMPRFESNADTVQGLDDLLDFEDSDDDDDEGSPTSASSSDERSVGVGSPSDGKAHESVSVGDAQSTVTQDTTSYPTHHRDVSASDTVVSPEDIASLPKHRRWLLQAHAGNVVSDEKFAEQKAALVASKAHRGRGPGSVGSFDTTATQPTLNSDVFPSSALSPAAGAPVNALPDSFTIGNLLVKLGKRQLLPQRPPVMPDAQTPVLHALNQQLLDILSDAPVHRSPQPDAGTLLHDAVIASPGSCVKAVGSRDVTVPLPDFSNDDDEWFWGPPGAASSDAATTAAAAAAKRSRRKSKAMIRGAADAAMRSEVYQQNFMIVSDLVGGLTFRDRTADELTTSDACVLLAQYKQLVSLARDLMK